MSASSLPHSVEAEEAVLGSILIDSGAFERIAPALSADDFYCPEHRLIYAAVTSLTRGGTAADVVTVHDELKRQGRDTEAGGLARLSELASG